MDYAKDQTKKLTAKREKAIDAYVANQEDFKTLNSKAIVTNFIINCKETVEDIDNCSKEQCELIDATKWFEERDELLESWKIPTQKIDAPVYMIAPFYIWDSKQRKDTCLDELDTEVIELINERTEAKLKVYSKYLTKDEE